MNAKKLLSLWGLKWNPFSPELPSEALLVTAKIESFAWRATRPLSTESRPLIPPASPPCAGR